MNTRAQTIGRSNAQDLQTIKWAGWSLVGLIVCAWSGWISLAVIANTQAVTRTEERQAVQYLQLRDDVAKLQGDVTELKTLLLQRIRLTESGGDHVAGQ